ncbi:MAG: hypothetical protein NZ534_12550, partial [Bacteroidia bacterium]|nr:hypothetical protein [Bacteroidia bacterium]
MPTLQDWSNALFRHYFNAERKGKTVLLCCDYEVVVGVGREAAKAEAKDFRSLEGRNDEHIYNSFLRLFKHIKKPAEWFDEIEKGFYERRGGYPLNNEPYG